MGNLTSGSKKISGYAGHMAFFWNRGTQPGGEGVPIFFFLQKPVTVIYKNVTIAHRLIAQPSQCLMAEMQSPHSWNPPLTPALRAMVLQIAQPHSMPTLPGECPPPPTFGLLDALGLLLVGGFVRRAGDDPVHHPPIFAHRHHPLAVTWRRRRKEGGAFANMKF